MSSGGLARLAMIVVACSAASPPGGARRPSWSGGQAPGRAAVARPPDPIPVRDEIVAKVVDQSHVPNHAVAMTTLDTVALLAVCEAADRPPFRIRAMLVMYGTMWLPRSVKRKSKLDRTVVDTASARAHEYGWHLNPATLAAQALIESEEVSYPSRSACEDELRALQQQAPAAFLAEARRTQEAENLGRLPWKR